MNHNRNGKIFVNFFILTILFYSTIDETYSFSNNNFDKNLHWHNTNYKKCSSQFGNNCYDYIVVGAGTAGSILARKLSDNPRNKVLLIEQGYWLSLNPIVQNASQWHLVRLDPLVERGYVSTAQVGFGNRSIPIPRAQGTGGCNSMNAMVFLLGNRKDFDERWGKIDGWSWNDLSPYWDSIQETISPTQLDPEHPIMHKLLKGAIEIGYKYNPNPNNLNSKQGQGGVSARILMAKQISNNYAERRSSWNAYIQPILPRKNLDILVFTQVTKVLFNKNLQAIGITTYNVGKKEYVHFYSRKEVILSAGVFDTPKLLLLSGIGPCDELNKYKIKCLANVQGVGKNLQDHTFIKIWSAPLRDQETPLPMNIFGMWGALAIEENGEYYHGLDVGEINGKKIIQIYTETFHYKSRGSITLLDKNPFSKPVIDPNLLSNSYDINKTLHSIKIARTFLSTKTISELTEDFNEINTPLFHTNDEKKLLEWIQQNIKSDAHPSSTCTMGNRFQDDKMIVVDRRLRVRHTKKLRIADASIIPNLISGNPNQITMIIGLKAADMIVEDNS
ncbi:unnamed protein product [Adineta steineri]|uniref:Uncharacterized protein n=2 Tax=Adineta steineri TaxID=433720 RepID=A0A815GHL0_9BILA|nr:unnamed protein product [Adineta steineri]